jgi:hypothetical protein
MHALGDAYTHTHIVLSHAGGIIEQMYTEVSGHVAAGHEADFIGSNPGKYTAYVLHLYGIMQGMNGGAQSHPEMITALLQNAYNLHNKYSVELSQAYQVDGLLPQDILEANSVRALPGGYDGPYRPELGNSPLPAIASGEGHWLMPDSQVDSLMKGLLNKIKNGIADCICK